MKYKIIILMATFIVGVQVTVGQAVFNRVNSVKIKSTWQELADTCVITVPFSRSRFIPDSNLNESVLYVTKDGATVQLKQGDPVSVDLSYMDSKGVVRTFTEFTGFVRRISATRPVEISCEDYAYLFRTTNITKTYKSTNITSIVKDIVSQVNAKHPKYNIKLVGNQEITVDKFRMDNVNAAQALQHIKERCMLVAWFHLDELYVGMPYIPTNTTPVKYALNGSQSNIKDHSLTILKAESRPFRVKYVGMDSDNKEVVVYYPEQDNFGELVTIKRTDISDKGTLFKLAQTLHKQKSFDGLEGSLTSWLIPQIRHSWTAQLIDPAFNLYDGRYMVDAVETTLDGGITRIITPGKKLA